MTKRISGSNTYNFTYDAENRMTGVSGAATATFVYDGDGNRVKTTINGTTTVYVGNYYEKTGSAVKKHYYAGGARVALRDNGTLRFLLGDHLSGTNVTTTDAGAFLASLRYHPWGSVRYANGSTPTKYQFTGQYSFASEFGLLDFKSRYYDPQLGRFAAPDTVIPEQSQGVQAWDRYAYANNSPVVYNDPSGHDVGCGDRDASECGTLPPSPTPAPSPEIPMTDSYYVKWPPDGYYVAGYKTTTDLPSVDWFHLITNGAGVVGDVLTLAAGLGLTPAGPVAGVAQAIDIAGTAVDVFEYTQNNDISNVSWDFISSLLDETKMVRVVPIIGLTLNLQGIYDAWIAGQVQVPILKPFPTIHPSTPHSPPETLPPHP